MRATPKPEQHPVTITKNLSTPGHEFPGSYPREHEQELQHQSCGDGFEGPAAATSVAQTARQYISEPVERTVEYAGQTAAAYFPIPQGVKIRWLPIGLDQQLSTSLPSSELKGAQPHEHVGGVGSLPGTISESSVALLPDERAERDTQRPIRLKRTSLKHEGDNQAKGAGAAAVAAKPEVSQVCLHLDIFPSFSMFILSELMQAMMHCIFGADSEIVVPADEGLVCFASLHLLRSLRFSPAFGSWHLPNSVLFAGACCMSWAYYQTLTGSIMIVPSHFLCYSGRDIQS
ncbi:hypothetical protein DFJ58DRAFT_663471 [Suillus subalutaceus]|uniref:uncharacterized protein n=1 Tax=Suillus subalutaceus TaxID=48586 RepID=UPI001B87B733|nr:uncharacterized protein DFJ58DRAFT_663471 [Suillus subalutaceus]KAG1847207.1 hypothetical protein DFJ58DRAFT_663471 [Suillus subalutaceus]